MMKRLLFIFFLLITIAGFGQGNEFKIRANMYLIADSLLVIGSDTLSGTTQIDGTDTIFVTLNYLNAQLPEYLTDLDSTGFLITESQISGLDHFTTADETDPVFNSHLASSITTADTTRWGTSTSEWNRTTQVLTGTTPTWDVDNGINAIDTLTATTTISFVNLEDGMNGILWVKNATTQYDIYFAGYTVKVDRNVQSTSTSVTTSGLEKEDMFWWNYNGVWVQITGKLDTE